MTETLKFCLNLPHLLYPRRGLQPPSSRWFWWQSALQLFSHCQGTVAGGNPKNWHLVTQVTALGMPHLRDGKTALQSLFQMLLLYFMLSTLGKCSHGEKSLSLSHERHTEMQTHAGVVSVLGIHRSRSSGVHCPPVNTQCYLRCPRVPGSASSCLSRGCMSAVGLETWLPGLCKHFHYSLKCFKWYSMSGCRQLRWALLCFP